jgi:hypothetical protein
VRNRIARRAIHLGGAALLLTTLAWFPATHSAASTTPTPNLDGCWQFNNQDYAFSLSSGSAAAVTGILVDSGSTVLNDETCDSDVPVGNLSGVNAKGNGYLAYITSGNSGWAITGVKGTLMKGYVYWGGASAAPTPAPSYAECEAKKAANKADPDSGWVCFEFTATDVLAPSTTKAATGKLDVALAGQRGSGPNTVAVTLTLSNPGSSTVSGLNFTNPTGLENDGVALSKGNVGPTQSGLALTSGPTPALPTSLPAKGSPIVVHYTYTATTSGDAVLVANASGTDASGNAVTNKAALTVYVTSPPTTVGDYKKLVTSALLATSGVTDQAQNTIANAEGDGLASYLSLPAASPGQQAAAMQVGLPPQMGVLVGTAKSSDFEQWMSNYGATLATDLKGGASSLGETGKAVALQLLLAYADPETQDKILGRVWDGVQALPANTKAALASTATNLGYVGQALAASLTPQGQDAWVNASTSELNSLKTNIAFAVDGFTDAQVADVNAYKNDPSGYLKANSTHYANATYDLIKAEVVTLLGEGIGAGIGAAAKSAGYGSLAGDATTIDATVAASVDSTAPVAADSEAAMAQKATVATSQFQTLPEGTALSVDQAAQLGGLVPGDQVGVQKALKYIKDTYGVDLELGVRTSEPLSLGINGSPKLSFMKPKAVSAMDMLMGGPAEISGYSAAGEPVSAQVFNGGVTTVFKPVPLPSDTLAAMGERTRRCESWSKAPPRARMASPPLPAFRAFPFLLRRPERSRSRTSNNSINPRSLSSSV